MKTTARYFSQVLVVERRRVFRRVDGEALLRADLLDERDARLDRAVAEARRLGEDQHARLLRLSGEGDARGRQHEQRHDEETAEHRGEPGHDPDGLVWRTAVRYCDAATPEPMHSDVAFNRCDG